jgi:hypothetical protein
MNKSLCFFFQKEALSSIAQVDAAPARIDAVPAATGRDVPNTSSVSLGHAQ